MISKHSEIIGKKVNQLFLESGLDQTEFGEKIGQDQSTVSKIIGGKWKNPTVGSIVLIAEAYKKPLAWFFVEGELPTISPSLGVALEATVSAWNRLDPCGRAGLIDAISLAGTSSASPAKQKSGTSE